MKKKSPLKVQPVSRYNKPKYPAHSDPNPIDHPETLPYPFSEKFLSACATFGIAGSLLFSIPQDEEPIESDATTIQIEQDSLENPFPFKTMGVPFTQASFGTGLPSRLSREEAILTIKRVFEKENIPLTPNYVFKKDSMAVQTDGFNEELGIGFLWVDYTNMGKGMVNSSLYGTPINHDITYLEKQIGIISNQYEEFIDHPDTYIKKNKSGKPWKQFINFLVEDFSKTPDKKQKDLFISKYMEYVLMNSQRAVYPDGVNEFVTKILASNSKNRMEEMAQANHLLELCKSFEKLKKYTVERSSWTFELREKIIQTADDATHQVVNATSYQNRLQALDNFKTFIAQTSRARYKRNDELMSTVIEMFKAPAKDKDVYLAKLDQLNNVIHISLDEAKYLANSNANKATYIAPISVRDFRFSFHNNYNRNKDSKFDYQRYQKITRQLYQYQPKEEREKLLLELDQMQRTMIDSYEILNKEKEITVEKRKDLMQRSDDATSEEERSALEVELRKLEVETMHKLSHFGHKRSLKQLEDQVRSYIKWSRQNQGF